MDVVVDHAGNLVFNEAEEYNCNDSIWIAAFIYIWILSFRRFYRICDECQGRSCCKTSILNPMIIRVKTMHAMLNLGMPMPLSLHCFQWADITLLDLPTSLCGQNDG